MPKIKVKPRASNAYCAPRLMPMMPAWRNCSKNGSVRMRLHSGHSQILSILDNPHPKRKMQFLCYPILLLSGPVTFTDVGIVDRQFPKCRRDLVGIVGGAGGFDRLQCHARG